MKIAICKECGKEMEHNQGSSATWLECQCGYSCTYKEAIYKEIKDDNVNQERLKRVV